MYLVFMDQKKYFKISTSQQSNRVCPVILKTSAYYLAFHSPVHLYNKYYISTKLSGAVLGTECKAMNNKGILEFSNDLFHLPSWFKDTESHRSLLALQFTFFTTSNTQIS